MAESPLKPVVKTPSPVTAAEPPPKLPTEAHTQTLKLKPLIRRPQADAAPAVPAAPAAEPVASAEAPAAAESIAEKASTPSVTEKLPVMQQLKGMTQKLKGITQQIPQQAILHKTGIIADSTMSEAQKQAAKSRTARISLSDAIGVSPVAEQPTPSRTIRIKRPENAIPLEKAIDDQAPGVDAAGADAAVSTDEQKTVSVTQKKTLRLSRPGAAVRPAGKFKKPAAVKPAAEGEATVETATEGAVPEAADAELEAVPAAAPSAPVRVKPDVPPAVAAIGLLLQLAACGVMGFVGWLLYQNTLYPAGWCF